MGAPDERIRLIQSGTLRVCPQALDILVVFSAGRGGSRPGSGLPLESAALSKFNRPLMQQSVSSPNPPQRRRIVYLLSRRIATLALTTSFAVEFSQLYNARWIDALRAYPLGHSVLGSGFSSHNLIAYAVGVAVGFVFEKAIREIRRNAEVRAI